MKKSHPTASTNVDDLKQQFEQQNLGTSDVEGLYAKVNKSPKEQRPQSVPEETVYATVKKQERDQRPLSQPETNPYAPQRPLNLENAYAVPRSGKNPKKLVSPYAVTDLKDLDGKPDPYHLENPLYEGNRGQRPQRPPSEHIYAELKFDQDSQRQPNKSSETIYAELGMGNGGLGSEHQENLIYQGVEKTRRTSPPRTTQDLVTSKLLQNQNFQYGVRETQEWCSVVYGNPHALNQRLSQILENPQNGEKILQDLLENPESAGRLAGQKLFGVKSPGRREAEEGFGALCAALERHIHTTKKIHKDLTREHAQHENVEMKHGSLERQAPHHHHHHHHRHHDRGREQNAQQQQEHQRSRTPSPKGGIAYAM